jgi:hypothetical protein
MWIRDELRIFTRVMPSAAERMQLREHGWIIEASRANLRRYLVAASNEFAPEERVEVLAALRPWAEFNGETDLVERFGRGETIREKTSLAGSARRLLRPLAHKLAHSVAHRS